ncbi:MAG: apolipoprotein N-acyltransferase [Acidobacteriota bacterium]|nr:apolipoprotein N-acyltransferase [Acidobacteriota bacterium]
MRLIPMRLWAMAILSGVLQVLPFPIAGPVPIWRTALCWIALTPLLSALLGDNARGQPLSPMQGAALGYCSGFVWYLGNCYWVYQTMYLYGGIAEPISAGILFLFCLYLALYHALFGALIAAFRRGAASAQLALLISPIAWVAVELARARITGFPWDLLGYTQVDNPLLIRLAPVAGAYGISFVIAAINALWLTRMALKGRRSAIPSIAIASVVVVLLFVVSEKSSQKPAHEGTMAVATLLQENLGVGAAAAAAGPALSENQRLQAFSALSMSLSNSLVCDGIPELASTNCQRSLTPPPHDTPEPDRRPTNLIVWPEAPNDFFEIGQPFRVAMSNLARAADAPIISQNIGIDEAPGAQRTYYNSASFITPDGNFAGRYDKMHLVPFGEYTPYKRLFFFAGNLLQNVGLFEPGTHRIVFNTGGHTYGTFICYESIFGDEVRKLENLGADVLVNVSDDGWYGDTSAAWEHLNMMRMRAIENHRWILRATNTGVTAAIDPNGRVVIAAPRHIRTSIRVGFDYEHEVTFYAAHGDIFAYLCALVTTLVLGWTLIRRTA